jgi:hypothetical protein
VAAHTSKETGRGPPRCNRRDADLDAGHRAKPPDGGERCAFRAPHVTAMLLIKQGVCKQLGTSTLRYAVILMTYFSCDGVAAGRHPWRVTGFAPHSSRFVCGFSKPSRRARREGTPAAGGGTVSRFFSLHCFTS